MHTRKGVGINITLATKLESSFVCTPAIPSISNSSDNPMHKDTSLEDLEAAFAMLGEQPVDNLLDPSLLLAQEITAGSKYDFSNLIALTKGSYLQVRWLTSHFRAIEVRVLGMHKLFCRQRVL